MNLPRRLVAPLTLVLLILVAGLAFNLHLQTRTEYPPAILDPDFGLWVSDPDMGGGRPLVWNLEYAKGMGDQVRLQETIVSGWKALEMKVFQDGADGNRTWLHLTQTIDGARLRALFELEVGVWVFSELPCACNQSLTSQSTIFGIEVNDGTHVITFIFSDRADEWQQFTNHRIIMLPTPAAIWAFHRIDLAREYDNAQWKHRPDRLSFSIILEAPGSATGWHTGYVHGFSWTQRATPSSAQQSNQQLATHSRLRPGIRRTHVEAITYRIFGHPSASQSRASDSEHQTVTRV